MPAKATEVLKLFRGKRVAIPLVVAVVILFFALGGFQKVLSLAVNEMAGFLLGTGDLPGEEVVEVTRTDENPARDRPSQGERLSGTTILNQVGPTEALAAPGERGSEAQVPVILAQAIPDSSKATEMPEDAAAPARRRIQTYTASFLRDPFRSLVSGEEGRPTKLLEVSAAKMVGSVWGESGIIALLEDDAGRSYALKVGDKVVNGRVVSVTPASVTFSITVFGLTRSVTLELAEEGEW